MGTSESKTKNTPLNANKNINWNKIQNKKSVILYINIYVPVFVLHFGWSFEDKTCTRFNKKIKNYLYNSERIQK